MSIWYVSGDVSLLDLLVFSNQEQQSGKTCGKEDNYARDWECIIYNLKRKHRAGQPERDGISLPQHRILVIVSSNIRNTVRIQLLTGPEIDRFAAPVCVQADHKEYNAAAPGA